ncbi:8736_t:CDS:1 [Ambispora leptoticha]|uniref:8736_t:CDS:1 n=1 Tax=Ambispora leptoticha TaxID=144679 RepID=A0A9N8WS21_9GLOM|nr:8736_t:CDS:1 [Ambispora leptoticha]
MTNKIADNSCNHTSLMTGYNLHTCNTCFNNIPVSDNLVSDHGEINLHNSNSKNNIKSIFDATTINIPIGTIEPTTSSISSLSSQAQIPFPEYLSYDATHMAGNLSEVTFDNL